MLGLGLLLLFAPERLTDMTATLAVFGLAVVVWLVLVAVDVWLARRAAARGSAGSAGAAGGPAGETGLH
jgi:hypothetical protein